MGCISATTSSKNDDYVDYVDYVDPLSQPLRREYLVAWYIRKFECKTNVSIPKEIILLCEAYFEDTIIKSQTQMDEKFMAVTNEHTVCFLGAGAVGLSSLIVRLVMNTFNDEYDPTIEDWYSYCMVVDGVKDTLEILDTAGQEEFSAMQDEYFRQYNAFVLVYSITSKTTFDRVQNDYEKIQKEKEDSPFVVVLCGNKIDLERYRGARVITTKQGQDLAKQWNNVPFIETSALTGENVRELFEILIREERARKHDYECPPNYSYYNGQHAHMPLSPVYGYQIQSNVYNTNNMSDQQRYPPHYIPGMKLQSQHSHHSNSSHHSESIQSFKWITNDNIQINKLNIPSPNNDNENDNDTIIGYINY